MLVPVKIPKKLIEVAFPIGILNTEEIQTELMKVGRIRSLDIPIWRRRLSHPVARAILFAQMVNDPSWKWEFENPNKCPTKKLLKVWLKERNGLYSTMKELLSFGHSVEDSTLKVVQEKLLESWQETCELNIDHPQYNKLFNSQELPSFYDPFVGYGTFCFEALNSFGLKAFASDVNPISFLNCEVKLGLPASYNSVPKKNKLKIQNHKRSVSQNSNTLGDEILHFGNKLINMVAKEISDFYPDVQFSGISGEGIFFPKDNNDNPWAWLWISTIKSPVLKDRYVPIVNSFMLSQNSKLRSNGEYEYIEPKIKGNNIEYAIRHGRPKDLFEPELGTRISHNSWDNHRCLLSNSRIPNDYITNEIENGRIREKVVAVIKFTKGRRFHSPDESDQELITKNIPKKYMKLKLEFDNMALSQKNYTKESRMLNIANDRQWATLNCLADAVKKIGQDIMKENPNLHEYRRIVSTYLTLAIVNYFHSGTRLHYWHPIFHSIQRLSNIQSVGKIGRINVEFNPISPGPRSIVDILFDLCANLDKLPNNFPKQNFRWKKNNRAELIEKSIISSEIGGDQKLFDPVYSNYVYQLLKFTLNPFYENQLETKKLPKSVAKQFSNMDESKFKSELNSGILNHLFAQIKENSHKAYPIAIHIKRESGEKLFPEENDHTSTMELLFERLIENGWEISSCWPLRVTPSYRSRGRKRDDPSQEMIITCTPPKKTSTEIEKTSLIRDLIWKLSLASKNLVWGNEAGILPSDPIDIPQILLGHGMATFSKYKSVLEQNGERVSVRSALNLIDRIIYEKDFDPDTRFLVQWFELYGWQGSDWLEADTLARSRMTELQNLLDRKLVKEVGKKIWLLKWTQFKLNSRDNNFSNLTVWESLHRIVQAFAISGINGAGNELGKLKTENEPLLHLLYKLYLDCKRQNRVEDKNTYKSIMKNWEKIEEISIKGKSETSD